MNVYFVLDRALLGVLYSGLFRANDLEASPRNGILRLFSSAASACK